MTAPAVPRTRKDFLSVLDFDATDLDRCLNLAAQIKADRPLGRQAPTASALELRVELLDADGAVVAQHHDRAPVRT